jgi:hypothetical protein
VDFLKLDTRLLDSTCWELDAPTRIVWLCLLLKADSWCKVEGVPRTLARAANVTLEECKRALDILKSPDPESRSKKEEGRRIREIEGGWYIINLQEYRDKKSTNYWAVKKAEQRERYKKNTKEVSHETKIN